METFIYIIPFLLVFIAFVASVISAYVEFKHRRKDKIDASIHYVERIVRDKYITTCNRELELDARNVANYISKVTCKECLKKIT